MPDIFFVGGGAGGGGERGPEGPAGPKGEFNFRGAWLVGTEYAKGDAVTQGGSTYASIKAANTGHEPKLLGEWWVLISEKGEAGAAGAAGAPGAEGPKGLTGAEGPAGPKGEMLWRGAWSGATEYAKGDAVEEGGSSYVSIKAANLNHKPSELGVWWALVAKAGAGGGAPTWENVEAVNANLEQPTAIQCAVINGLVFLRGKGKVKTEIAAKGILFTLPVACRPAVERSVMCSTTIGGATENMLNFKTNGEVEVVTVLAVGKLPMFDGLCFSL